LDFIQEDLMSTRQSERDARIEQLKTHLKNDGYCAEVQRHYPPIALRFLGYLCDQDRSVETARASDVEGFLRREHRSYRKRHQRAPRDIDAWRIEHAGPARLLLRIVHGRWPLAVPPTTRREAFHRELLDGYDAWMRELRGLAATTRGERVSDARRILDALGDRSDPELLSGVEVNDIDAYVRQRSAGLRRSSIKYITGSLRIFLRYLYGCGRMKRDLSGTVTSPTLYAYEGIPSALLPGDVRSVLAVTRQDRTAGGLRDYAILSLLSTYGLRAGEITALRLEDIDWKKEILHVRHSKTGANSTLPLLREPGEALFAYLKDARPRTGLREVFLCMSAPLRPFGDGSALYSTIRNRLTAAGVMPVGKRGPHAFRHARAVSLLRAAVPLKAIGDILGHRSEGATGAYLKLATEDLRGVALDIPTAVSP
jgi:integrase/recombinase XerD